jgi:hypothetical protein
MKININIISDYIATFVNPHSSKYVSKVLPIVSFCDPKSDLNSTLFIQHSCVIFCTYVQQSVVKETINLFAWVNMLFNLSLSSLLLRGKILQPLFKHSVVCGSEVMESV